jgi:hypothetical protein
MNPLYWPLILAIALIAFLLIGEIIIGGGIHDLQFLSDM